MLKVIGAAIFLFATSAQAEERIEKYSSVALTKKGATAYKEEHEVKFKDGRVQSAKTKYLDMNGNPIGEMTSDFSKRVTVPDYEYKDHRTEISHGIKTDGDKIILWNKGKDGEVRTSGFSFDLMPPETLLVGCQGLHYYLIDNLEKVKERKSIPLAYFMPGRLDYFKFTLKLDREDEKYIYLKLTIDNLFLKLFTSALHLKYSKADRRLVQFSGLSNITDENDQLQNVVIDYKYD